MKSTVYMIDMKTTPQENLLAKLGRLVVYDRITYYGAASPGTGTRLSREL